MRARQPGSATGRRRAAGSLALAAMALVSCASPETGRSDSSSGSGSESAPRAPLGPVDAVRTVVVGDEATTTTPSWPDLLAAAVEEDGMPMTVHTVASAGAGFAGAPAFAETVEASAEGSTQLVVVFDGRLESDDPADLAPAAHRLSVAVERAAPDARLVVIGPLPGAGASAAARDALRAEAEDAGAIFVDPVAEDWPSRPAADQLAVLLRSHVEELVAALAASGANR